MRNLLRIGIACLLVTAVLVAAADAAAAKSPKVKAKPSAGCGAAAPVAAGEEKITTTSGGVERTYFRHVPPAHDGATPVPLVVDLHGYLETASIQLVMSKLGPFGDEKGFVTVTPQGLGAVALWDLAPDGADVTFISDMLDEVESALCIDERRVYATGLSMGAFMTSTLVCALSDRIAAGAPVAGVQDTKPCKQDRPVPVVAFHGTADKFVAFDGGLGTAAADLPNPDGSGRSLGESTDVESRPKGPSVPEKVAAIAKRNGCAAKSTEKHIGTDVTLVHYKCPGNADVDFYRIEGGGHAWPGSEFSKSIESVVGTTTFTIDADEVMWKFFEQHPLRSR